MVCQHWSSLSGRPHRTNIKIMDNAFHMFIYLLYIHLKKYNINENSVDLKYIVVFTWCH